MTAQDVQAGPSMLADLIAELQLGGASRPAEIARRLGGDWSQTVSALAELFSDGVVGHSSEVGLWWIA